MPSAQRSLARGIALTLAAGFLFASLDAYAKFLLTFAPLIQIMWIRFLVHTTAVAGFHAGRRRAFLRLRRPALQILRSAALLASTLSMYGAILHVPLADATAMLFVAPLIITVASALFLRERIGIHRWASILVCLAGVVLVAQPGQSGFSPWLLLALLAAFSNAVYFMLTRELSGMDEAAATQFNTTALGAVGLTIAAAIWWEPLTPETLAMLLGVGLLSAAAHGTLQYAFSHASAALLSPFLYSHLVFAALFGVTFFGDTPRLSMLGGSALIVGAGLFIWWRENDAAVRRYALDDEQA